MNFFSAPLKNVQLFENFDLPLAFVFYFQIYIACKLIPKVSPAMKIISAGLSQYFGLI